MTPVNFWFENGQRVPCLLYKTTVCIRSLAFPTALTHAVVTDQSHDAACIYVIRM